MTRYRMLAALAAVGVVGALCAGCSTTVDGRGTAVPAHGSSSGHSASARGGAVNSAARLETLLSPRPFGAIGWDDAWAADVHPTIQQFVDREYAPSYAAYETRFLRAQGLVAIVHRTWIVSNNDQADIVLLSFRTDDGAAARFTLATNAKRADPRDRISAVVGLPDSEFTYMPTKDSYGFIRSVVYVRRASIVEEVFTFTKPTLHRAEVESWARKQAARLP